MDRNKAGLEALPDEIHTEVADATDPTVPGPLVDRLTAEVGPPDVLVNTIGAYARRGAGGGTGDASEDDGRELGDGTVAYPGGRASHAEAGLRRHSARRRPAGRGTGLLVSPPDGVSKAALVHLVRTLDVELRGHGIRVNVVLPQIMATAKNKALFPPEALTGAVEPGAIAEVIAFLVSDAAAPTTAERSSPRTAPDLGCELDHDPPGLSRQRPLRSPRWCRSENGPLAV